VKIRGERMWLWRAVDDEGEVLDMLVKKRRNTGAALRLLRKLLRRNSIHPESFVTDKLASYRAAFRELHCGDRHRPGRMPDNNRAENSHLVIRRRNASNSGSSLNVQRKDFSRLTPPFTITSTCKDT